MKFDMVKWNLYRAKVDNIDERWHMFKKRQMKISWWLQLIKRHFAIKKSKFNFDEHMRLTIKRCREMLLAFRI